MSFVANTNEQPLSQHLIAVSELSELVYKTLFNGNGGNACKQAGLLHDIGKVDNDFQTWVTKKIKRKEKCDDNYHNENSIKNFEDMIRHNELSWAFISPMDILEEVKYAVLWHHAEKYRKHKIKTKSIINDSLFQTNLVAAQKVLNDVGFSLPKMNYFDINMPSFKNIDKVGKSFKCNNEQNVKNTIVRLCVVVADRIISSLSKTSLDNIVKNNLYQTLLKNNYSSRLPDDIDKMLLKFEQSGDSGRNKKQSQAASECADNRQTVVLQGPAGVGKTKVSLEWVKNISAERIIYVCPRVSICQSLYNDIKSEYLPNSSVQIFTGEYKSLSKNGIEHIIEDNEFLNADVVITTIDQMISLLTNHNRFDKIADVMKSALIFDEFHEIIKTPSMAVYLKEIIGIREMAKNAKTLLMSATPNPLLLDFMFDQNRYNMVNMKSFHDKKYDFIILDSLSENIQDHPMSNMEAKDNSFFISNNIGTAQVGFLNHIESEKHNTLVVHSAFTKAHRDKIFSTIYSSFGKNGDKSIGCLRSGPILQASLNISAKNIYSDISSPEDILQRIGRCNRFCENEIGQVTLYNTIKNKSVSKYISSNFCLKSSSLFVDYLKTKYCGTRFEVDLDRLYNDYFEFYKKHKKECLKDINIFKEMAYKKLYENDYFKPIDFFYKKAKDVDSNKLANKSIRGSSVYVIPTVTKFNNNQFNEIGWLYDPKNVVDNDNLLCMDVNDYRLQEILSVFVNIAKHKNDLYGLSKYYNKYNTKTKDFIVKSAKMPNMGIFIGDLDGEKAENFNFEGNFTYLFDEGYKGNLISIGLIDKSILENKGN